MIVDKLLAFLLKSLSVFLLLLPRRIALIIGRFLGHAAYYIFRQRRRLAIANIRLALGNDYSESDRTKIIKESFVNLGLNLVEFLRLCEITAFNLDEFVSFQGLEHMDKALEKNHGILTLNAHLGNWELLAASMALRGINSAIVVKKARQKSVDDFITKQRETSGMKVLRGKHLIKDILRHLRQNGVVGIVLDQSAIKSNGIVVPFFGRPASTLKSLAILSLRTNAPVLPVYIYRDGDKHHVVIHPPVEHHDNGVMDDATIASRTLQYTQSIEAAIREHPEQWTWTHNRWKVRK